MEGSQMRPDGPDTAAPMRQSTRLRGKTVFKASYFLDEDKENCATSPNQMNATKVLAKEAVALGKNDVQSAPVEALSQYELERLQRIEANMKQLRALGVLEAAAELKAESSRKKERRGWSSEKTKSQAAAGPQVASRQSTRLRKRAAPKADDYDSNEHEKSKDDEEVSTFCLYKRPNREGPDTDLDTPKKGLSAYMFFCQDMRDTVKAENPEMKVTEVTTELGRRWKAMSEKEKEQYHERAAADKVRYEEDFRNYKPPAGESKRNKKEESSAASDAAKLDAHNVHRLNTMTDVQMERRIKNILNVGKMHSLVGLLPQQDSPLLWLAQARLGYLLAGGKDRW